MTTAKSFLDAAELINFNKGEAISQCFPKMTRSLKPPPGWEDHHEVLVILFLSKGADLNGLQFADVMKILLILLSS